ncbi:hypothetical protein K440DRAFT_179717 [Wilcoxina mikolae CBS 423.85]|nr:hypothetical protein K440DRAFT_179717 [Wilcoxina mikolae CBS 423.85]
MRYLPGFAGGRRTLHFNPSPPVEHPLHCLKPKILTVSTSEAPPVLPSSKAKICLSEAPSDMRRFTMPAVSVLHSLSTNNRSAATPYPVPGTDSENFIYLPIRPFNSLPIDGRR